MSTSPAHATNLPNLDRVTPVDEVGVQERVSRFCKRSIKKDSKVAALKLALAMIDLTTLEGQDTPGKVQQLCQKAMHLNGSLGQICPRWRRFASIHPWWALPGRP